MDLLVFVVSAAFAAFSGAVAVSTHGQTERYFGTLIGIFAGLTAVTLPQLIQTWKKEKL